MDIFVTGGTGFIGTYVLQELNALGFRVRCLSRSERAIDGAEAVRGDILDPESLDGTMDGCAAVIHLVGIIEEMPAQGITFKRIYEEGTRNIVAEARKAGIGTFVYMSANGARKDGVSDYQTGKWAAERAVLAAGFESATIFRPSIVFGQPSGGTPEFCTKLVDELIAPFPILPIFGDGQYKMQPVAVESVATGFAKAATEPVPGVREYGVSGPEALPYVEIVDIITRASGRQPKPKINIPISLVRMGIDATGWTGLLPISRDQLDMLVEGNTCPSEPFHADFEIDPVAFTVDTLSYLKAAVK